MDIWHGSDRDIQEERYKRLSRLHFLTKIDVARQASIFTFISSRKKITWAYVQELLDILRVYKAPVPSSRRGLWVSAGRVMDRKRKWKRKVKDKQKRGTEISWQTTSKTTVMSSGSVSLIVSFTSHIIAETWKNTFGVVWFRNVSTSVSAGQICVLIRISVHLNLRPWRVRHTLCCTVCWPRWNQIGWRRVTWLDVWGCGLPII